MKFSASQIVSMGVSAGYNVDLALEIGVVEAIVLNKLVYLHKETTREDGFTWYTAKDWRNHTGLTDRQVKRALNHLVELGYIEMKNTYIKGTQVKCRHYRLLVNNETSKSDFDKMSESETDKMSESETDKMSESLTNNIEHNIERSNIRNSDELLALHLFICDLFHKNPDRIALTDKRKRHLRARIKQLGSAERLRQAYIAISKSPFHMGENKSGWRADRDVYWLAEHPEKAEEWANRAEDKTPDFNDENISLQDLREMGLWE